MAKLVDDPEHPLIQMEGDYKELNPRDQMALVYLAMGKKKTWIATKLHISQYQLCNILNKEISRRFVSELTQGAHLQMEAMYVKSVDAVRETLEKGDYSEKIKAARLQMEATKRIGAMTMPLEPLVDTNLRLAKLAERLLMLNDSSKRAIETRRTEHGYQAEIVIDEVPAPTQAAGGGEGPVSG